MQTPISIHALHEESDESDWYLSLMWTFQSTLSMRRATSSGYQCSSPHIISFHALHEESDGSSIAKPSWSTISIHALHEESDTM